MLRSLSDSLLRVAARFRPRVRTRWAVAKVNLGAGIEATDGWINVDGGIHALAAGAPAPVLAFLYRRTGTVRRLISESEYVRRLTDHEFVFCDFANGLPFEADSVDFIFCSHVLEHFYAEEASRLMREVRRVLKPGGRVRICVPDLAIAVRHYHEGNKREALRFFFTDERARFDQHHNMYDYDLLSSLMQDAGFAEIVQCDFQQGRLPDLDRLDNRPEETLFVEAVKP